MTSPDPRSDESVAATNEGLDPAAGVESAGDIDDQLRKAESEAAELKDAWLRARAEAENARRQSREDVARATKFAIEKFAQDLLPVKDALEQALAAQNVTVETLRSGAELTLKNLQAAFARANVQEIDPAGERFDPHRHQAVQVVETDQPANTVVNVYQKGYVLNDRVLRPAMVTVAKGAAQD